MEKPGKWLAPLMCAAMPLIPLSYLYVRNAECLSGAQAALAGAGMAALSLVGYWLFK